MSEKNWTNHWVCDPEFAELEPLMILHKEHDVDNGKFVMPAHFRADLQNVHTLFRQKFSVPEKVTQAFIDISADDYYKLYINGRFVTQGPANSYYFAYRYQHVDITEFLKPGENIIAVHVYYHGPLTRAFSSGDHRQGLIAEILAEKTQEQLSLLTDCWKCTRAREYTSDHLIAYETQFNEIIDNRLKITGWKEADFDDSAWDEAPLKTNDDHILVLQEIPNLQFEKKEPVSVTHLTDGCLLDFGKELTGTFSLKAKGKEGDRITIRFGEELLSPDQVRHQLRCNCDYEDGLILAEGTNELEQFDYKCFRYVQLIAPSHVELTDFRVDYRHYPFDDSNHPCPSDDVLINQIWEICRNAVINCSQEAFYDCPHREKGQYLGDLTVTAHSFFCLTGDARLFRKALNDFADSTVICKGMMAVAPGNFMQEIADFSLMYPYQLLLYYKMTGDLDFLRSKLAVAEGLEEFFDAYRNEDGLLESVKAKWNLVDWPANLRDDYDFEVTKPIADGCHNVINALYVGMKQCMEEIRDLLKVPQTKQSLKLKEAFQKAFYNPQTGLFVDAVGSKHSSLHANTFAGFYGLYPEGHNIPALIREKGLCCGVYTAYFVLYALLRMDEKELAYELITNKSEHSWYQMLKEGATTSYEAWGKDQKWNTSLCHAWASAPIPVLLEMTNTL